LSKAKLRLDQIQKMVKTQMESSPTPPRLHSRFLCVGWLGGGGGSA